MSLIVFSTFGFFLFLFSFFFCLSISLVKARSEKNKSFKQEKKNMGPRSYLDVAIRPRGREKSICRIVNAIHLDSDDIVVCLFVSCVYVGIIFLYTFLF